MTGNLFLDLLKTVLLRHTSVNWRTKSTFNESFTFQPQSSTELLEYLDKKLQ